MGVSERESGTVPDAVVEVSDLPPVSVQAAVRRRWRRAALLWAVTGMCAYFAVVNAVWLFIISGSWLLAGEAALAAIVMILVFGWPAWLVVWGVAVGCGSLALRGISPENPRWHKQGFQCAIALGCGVMAYVPYVCILGFPTRFTPFSPEVLALVTCVVGFFAAGTYYPGAGFGVVRAATPNVSPGTVKE